MYIYGVILAATLLPIGLVDSKLKAYMLLIYLNTYLCTIFMAYLHNYVYMLC